MTERSESLESLLSKAPHIDDDGFTATLMARLPPGRPSLRMQTIILLAATLTPCSIVMAIPGARHFLTQVCVGIFDGLMPAGSSLLAAGIVVAVAVWGAAAAVSEA